MVKYSLPLDAPNYRQRFREFKSKFDVQCTPSNTKGTLQAVLKAIPPEYKEFHQRRNATMPVYVNIMLAGNGSVGKTCTAIRHSFREFPMEYIPTIFDITTMCASIGPQNVIYTYV